MRNGRQTSPTASAFTINGNDFTGTSDGGVPSVVQTSDPNYSTLNRDEYKRELPVLQARLSAALDKLEGRAWAFVFEGRDTAGKTGTITKMMAKLDEDRIAYNHHSPPMYPSEKKNQRDLDYWQGQMPKPGRVMFFDRSWYSNLLGLRVNSPDAMDWGSLIKLINSFEKQNADAGVGISKFFLDIEEPEQRRRVQYRKTGPKEEREKFSVNDERSVAQYDLYTPNIEEMLRGTGTPWAPWYSVDMTDKWRGRLRVMTMAATQLENQDPALSDEEEAEAQQAA